MKKCTKCGTLKELNEFFKSKINKSGYIAECKKCAQIRRDKWRVENREKYLKSSKEYNKYRRNNPELHKKDLKKGRDFGKTLKGRYGRTKSSAKQRDIHFNITLDEFKTYWNNNCYYCGSKVIGTRLDRIDNKKGYNIKNCVQCCTMCNIMKNNQSLEGFKERIKNIYINIILE